MPKINAANAAKFGRYYVLFTSASGKILLFLQAHATHSPQPHPPCLLLAPFVLPSKNVFVFSIDAYGALVILYHGWNDSSPLALSKSVKPRPTSWTPRFFNKHLTHTPSPYIHFSRASCQPLPPLDEIISVRAHPLFSRLVDQLFCANGVTHPPGDTPLSTLRVRQVDFPSSGAAGDSLHATFRA